MGGGGGGVVGGGVVGGFADWTVDLEIPRMVAGMAEALLPRLQVELDTSLARITSEVAASARSGSAGGGGGGGGLDLGCRFLYFNHLNLALKVSGIGDGGAALLQTLHSGSGGGGGANGAGAGGAGGIVLPADPNALCRTFKDVLCADTIAMLDQIHADFR